MDGPGTHQGEPCSAAAGGAPSAMMGSMSTIEERYDRDAEDYARYWGPVLAATARRLLGEAAPVVEAALAVAAAQRRPARLLDI